MIPNKIYYFLGYNNLGLMLDQERKHWLLKTDKKKWMQDKVTGDTYQGQIDNIGSDIIIETEKLPVKYDTVAGVKWDSKTNADRVFSIAPSAFTYSTAVNGLLFARIESVNYPTTNATTMDTFHHYQIRFNDCQPCLIPFGGSPETSDVFVGKWIKTFTPPTLVLLNDNGEYLNEVSIPFESDITGAAYYYPLEETLQPIALNKVNDSTYVTEGLTSNEYIGYPAFWFTCDKSDVGPAIKIANWYNINREQLIVIGNAGNASKYRAKLYVGVDGNLDCTPDGSPTSGCYLICNAKSGSLFDNKATDFTIPIEPSSIRFDDFPVQLSLSSENSVITMTPNDDWEFVDSITYQIKVSAFNQNCLQVASNPLVSAFDVHLDETIPFGNTTNDVGYAGIRMSSSNDHSDIYPKYPHELNLWSGLPEWLQEETDYSPEHMAIYAIHNTPTYSPGLPETRQTAALLLDPGKSKNTKDDKIIDEYNRTHPYVEALLNEKPTASEIEDLVYWYEHIDEVTVNQVGYIMRMLPKFQQILPYATWSINPNQYLANYVWTGVLPEEPFEPSHITDIFWQLELCRLIALTAYHVFVTEEYIPTLTEAFENDERGRVYVLSNDSTDYVNNNATSYPKPDRTVARICDIPTSAMQLNGVSGLSPTQVVDPKYVRQEASYNLEDKNRLYNDMASRWVRPNCYDAYGNIVQTDNEFVFTSLENLNKVDLINHNNFRVLENLVPEVDPYNVIVSSIYNAGTGYQIDDIGVIMVGGYAFNYIVSKVNDVGGVTDVDIAPTKDTTVHLSNFEMTDGGEGITEPYGTSPVKGKGTGLKVRLRINDYASLQIKKGEIFTDLFALARDTDGLWLYTYNINTSSTDIFKTGTWEKSTLISQFEDSTYGENGNLSSAEAMMVAMVPQRKQLPVCKYSTNVDPTSIDTLTTASFINIIDTTKTPVEIPNNITNSKTPNQEEVDITKFYCNGILTLSAQSRTVDAVFKEMDAYNMLRNNCYVFWKWASTSGTKFQCGVIYRSLNNLRSTDKKSLLPKNDLEYPKYVDTNANTTVVWDVPNVGVMMWIYNPTYKKCEKYSINPDTKELCIDRVESSWENIEIRNPTSATKLSLLDSSKFFQYNVWTNCTPYATEPTNDSIYAQYKFVQIISQGTSLAIANQMSLAGNWELVFPRVHSFSFTNDSKDVSYTPVQMQTIRGYNLPTVGNIVDDVTGYKVDQKTLLLNQTDSGVSVRLFNPENSKWETI